MKQYLLGDLESELNNTRRLLERVPEEHFGWKPHEKSMSLGRLSAHIVNLLQWHQMTLERDGLDMATLPPQGDLPESRDALLAHFDALRARLTETLAATPDEAMGQPWTLRRGDRELFSMPRGAALRSMSLNHLLHHRGQLTVYLRLLDVPLPPIYGPTADEGGMR